MGGNVGIIFDAILIILTLEFEFFCIDLFRMIFCLDSNREMSHPAQRATHLLMEAIRKYNTKEIGDIVSHNKNLDINRTDKVTGNTPLSYAITLGFHDVVIFLIKHGANVNVPNSDGTTPIFPAISKSHIKFLYHLCIHGADINVQAGPFKNTPLHEALLQHKLEFAKFLIERGANIDIENVRGRSARTMIKESGFISEEDLKKSEELGKKAKDLFDKIKVTEAAAEAGGAGAAAGGAGAASARPSEVPITKEKQLQLIYQAIIMGHVDKLKSYLEKPGFDIDITTALVPAARKGNVEMFKLLLALNPPIDAELTKSLMLNAIEAGKYEMVVFLLDLPLIDETLAERVLSFAIDSLQVELIQNIVRKYSEQLNKVQLAIINHLENNRMEAANKLMTIPELSGTSIFKKAVSTNNINLVKLLIDKRVDIDPVVAGQALANALVDNKLDMANVLLTVPGIDVNQKSREGIVPLSIVAQKGLIDIASIILTIPGVNINLHDVTYVTPLVYAIHFDHFDIARLLIEAGADVNILGNNDTSPLVIAISKKNIELVQLLIERNANVNTPAKSPILLSPLQFAVSIKSTEIVRLLLAVPGIDVNFKSGEGKTALDYAKEPRFKNPEIIALLKPKWKGWSRSDVDVFNTVFLTELDPAVGRAPVENKSVCPVCLKYVDRTDGCRYMSHDCAKLPGFYHEALYNKYKQIKNGEYYILWCTICNRICRDFVDELGLPQHGHLEYGPSDGPIPRVKWNEQIRKATHFGGEADCIQSGGGGREEKIMRFRHLREFALLLNEDVDKIPYDEAMEKLVEEMWNAPLHAGLSALPKRKVAKIMKEGKWNIPNTNFPLPKGANAEAVAPVVPYPFADRPAMIPILHREVGMNNISLEDAPILIQLVHRRADGTIRPHEQKISIKTLFNALDKQFGSPGTDHFGVCMFDDGCNGLHYPDELQSVLNRYPVEPVNPAEEAEEGAISAAERARYQGLIDKYRTRFNEAYHEIPRFKEQVDRNIAAGADMPVGGAGAGAGHVGGKRTYRKRKHRVSTRRIARPRRRNAFSAA